jgi:Rrf2 family protein
MLTNQVIIINLFRQCLSGKELKLMKMSTKGRYGTRLLLDLAFRHEGKPVPLKEIALRQQIPLQYLEHLIKPLIAGGILRSMRGARGGVLLARAPDDIKLSEAIRLLEGSIAPVDCLDNPDICRQSTLCVTRDVWGELKKAMNGVLAAKKERAA